MKIVDNDADLAGLPLLPIDFSTNTFAQAVAVTPVPSKAGTYVYYADIKRDWRIGVGSSYTPSLPFLAQYLPVSSTAWRLPPFRPDTRSLYTLRHPPRSLEPATSSKPLINLPLACHPRPRANRYHRTKVRTTILHSPRPAPPASVCHQTSDNMHRSKHHPKQPFSSPRRHFHHQ
jgi:hypothetical protein